MIQFLPHHPALQSPRARFTCLVLIALRSVFFILFVLGLDQLVTLGTRPIVLVLTACAAVPAGSWLAFTPIRLRGLVTLALLVLAALYLLTAALDLLPLLRTAHIFLAYNFWQHGLLIALIFIAAGLSTWAFWRHPATASMEMLLISAVTVYLLAGHRNYHFDMPRLVNTLAWEAGMEPLSMLIVLGVVLVVMLLTYIGCCMLPGRPSAARGSKQQELYRGRPAVAAAILMIVLSALVVHIVSREIHRHYLREAITRIANGVGQARQEGTSPLGFHSALGGSNQPAGLVRLEGDYQENPFSPMLYLRETALSAFNGRELTLAGRSFDTDVNATGPFEAFTGREDPALADRRVPVIQSIYLMAEHQSAFALDYPVAIAPLKNPAPNRFKAAYRAHSIAPAFARKDLLGLSVGDEHWTPEIRQHYLEPHSDPRYGELARKLSHGLDSPVSQAFAITDYLARTAIYTLTPHHDVKPQDDPVAPFLFGDHRGYCVHFAHATVYLLRALGIPSRIGTGYLSDLSQARDGHILLRMSDRHAWAEVYIGGIGWVPFDIRPAQVESHAETQVDMKLLEELMGLLDPGEEILPDDLMKNEKTELAPSYIYLPGARDLARLLALLLALIVAAKLYLRYGWLLPGSPAARLVRSYRAITALLYDLGYQRNPGETRSEFRARVEQELGKKTLSLTEPLLAVCYSPQGAAAADPADIRVRRRNDLQGIKGLKMTKRLLAWFNPVSLFTLLRN